MGLSRALDDLHFRNTLKTQEFGHMGTVQLSCGQCGEFAVRYVKTKNGEGTYMCEVRSEAKNFLLLQTEI